VGGGGEGSSFGAVEDCWTGSNLGGGFDAGSAGFGGLGSSSPSSSSWGSSLDRSWAVSVALAKSLSSAP